MNSVNNIIKKGVSFSSIVTGNKSTKPSPSYTYKIPESLPEIPAVHPSQITLLEQIKKIIDSSVNAQTSRLLEHINANTNKIDILAESMDIVFNDS